jgi:signal peptidase I
VTVVPASEPRAFAKSENLLLTQAIPSPSMFEFLPFMTPRYVKRAKLLLQGVQKFIDYKRDLLKPEKLSEIVSLRDEYKSALKERNREKLGEMEKKITEVCDAALPPNDNAAIGDWVESLVTCVVIVIGIRAFFVQPFKIPTGSMQPTLNGIVATPNTDAKPNVAKQGWDLVMRGRNYVRVESPVDGAIVGVRQKAFGVFVTYTMLDYVSSTGEKSTQYVWVPQKHLFGAERSPGIGYKGLWQRRDPLIGEGQVVLPLSVKKGELLASGYVDTGDLVLVDKVSYHFRRPQRGEVFVFNTKNIDGIQRTINPLEGSQHYIKRLVGLPGDKIEVKGPDLLIDDQPVKEKGPRRVVDERVPLGQWGYHGYSRDGSYATTGPIDLANQAKNRRYMACGDNSYNSSDSRMWGPVPEPNLVGPGLFTLWPITSGHWGLIK